MWINFPEFKMFKNFYKKINSIIFNDYKTIDYTKLHYQLEY